jgi:hypothetical protein
MQSGRLDFSTARMGAFDEGSVFPDSDISLRHPDSHGFSHLHVEFARDQWVELNR